MAKRTSTIAESPLGIVLGRHSMVIEYPMHRIVVGADVTIDAAHLGQRGEIGMASAHAGAVPAAALLWHLTDSEDTVIEADSENLTLTFACGCIMSVTAEGGSPEDVAIYRGGTGDQVMDRWPADYL